MKQWKPAAKRMAGSVWVFLLVGFLMAEQGVPYEVRPLAEAIQVDGVLAEEAWQSAVVLTDLTFPWRKEVAPRTEFRALGSKHWFAFSFVVSDDDLVVVGQTGKEDDVALGDRVELFFSRDTECRNYYAVEIGPTGQILDYAAQYYRSFDSGWDFPDLNVSGRLTQSGFVIEGLISFPQLERLGVLHPGNLMRVGVFRAEFETAEQKPLEKWISWVDPQTVHPDFHVPRAFGVFQLPAER